MPRDATGTEIYPGDTVRCLARYYNHIRYGEMFEVRATGGNCIESDAMNKRYGFDAKFKGCNFEIVYYGPHNPMSGCHQIKGQINMMYLAVRIDTFDGSQEPANIFNNHSGVETFARPTYNQVKNDIEFRIKANGNERWVIFSPTHMAELSSPPVRFKAL